VPPTIHAAALVTFLALSPPPAPAGTADIDRACLSAHASRAERAYAAALASALALRADVRAFCAAPTGAGLAKARASWIAARVDYGRTEALRFGGGPIDARRGGRETWLNAWPVDEAYIEPADRSQARGIIGDPATYPSLGRAILRLLNQRGGETNVCTGWHAIEFMLWGEDRSDDGPGSRPVADFLDASGPRAARRREYLLEVTELLCEDLDTVARAWRAGEGEFRERFLGDPGAMRAVLTGPALLAGFEMSGERMAVALETRDQEEEHSCFSDTTHLDFRANIEGIRDVLAGNDGAIAAIRARDPAAAARIDEALARALRAVNAMPAPFDRAVRSPDGSAERARITEAMESLESLSDAIGAGARAIGLSLPSEPQG
jgi:putative iron-regulated protein